MPDWRDSHEMFQNVLVLLFLWHENTVGKVCFGLGKRTWLGLGKDNGWA